MIRNEYNVRRLREDAKIVNIIKIIVFKAAIIHDFLKTTNDLKYSLLVNYINIDRFN